MIYLYKYGGKKCCFDTESGAVIPLSSLQYKMLGTLEAPLPPLCPTSLRYELAKFDSEDVNEAYGDLRELFSRGLIFSDGDRETVCISTSGKYAVSDAGEADMIFSFARTAGMTKYRVYGSSDLNDCICREAEKHGLTKIE